MRTTVDLPEDLLKEAMRLSKTKSKTSTLILSLHELINLKKIDKLRSLRGKLNLDIDLKALRRDRTSR